MNAQSPDHSPSTPDTTRLEAFSDGVFAIAITLLVLELKIPAREHFGNGGITSASLGNFLAMQWPSYFAFVTSFFTVLVMWVHHHAMFKLIRRTDPTLLFANGFLLMLVTAVPFPTGLVAQYLMTPGAKMACLVYSGLFVLVGLSFYLLMLAAFRDHLLDPVASPEIKDRFRRSYRAGPILYLIATVSAFLSVWLCMAICTALWIYWAATTTGITMRSAGPKPADHPAV